MLADLIYQGKGRIIGTRILNAEKGKVEYSASGEGRFKDISVTEIDTFWSMPSGENTFSGEGQGILTTKDGKEHVTFKGYGIGHKEQSGRTSFRGTNFYKTPSDENLSFLNNMVGVFEFELDELGNSEIKIWEWR